MNDRISSELIFKTGKTKTSILLNTLTAALFLTMLFAIVFFIQSGEDKSNVLYLSLTAFIFFFLSISFEFRYYIREMESNGDVMTVRYLYWFQEKCIQLHKSEIYFRLNDYRRKRKCFEIIKGDKLIIRQTPFLEWAKNDLVKAKLEHAGFLFKTYW